MFFLEERSCWRGGCVVFQNFLSLCTHMNVHLKIVLSYKAIAWCRYLPEICFFFFSQGFCHVSTYRTTPPLRVVLCGFVGGQDSTWDYGVTLSFSTRRSCWRHCSIITFSTTFTPRSMVRITMDFSKSRVDTALWGRESWNQGSPAGCVIWASHLSSQFQWPVCEMGVLKSASSSSKVLRRVGDTGSFGSTGNLLLREKEGLTEVPTHTLKWQVKDWEPN